MYRIQHIPSNYDRIITDEEKKRLDNIHDIIESVLAASFVDLCAHMEASEIIGGLNIFVRIERYSYKLFFDGFDKKFDTEKDFKSLPDMKRAAKYIGEKLKNGRYLVSEAKEVIDTDRKHCWVCFYIGSLPYANYLTEIFDKEQKNN